MRRSKTMRRKTWLGAAATLLLAGAIAASAGKPRETVTSATGSFDDGCCEDEWLCDYYRIPVASSLSPCEAEPLYDDAWTSGLFDI